MKRKILTNAGMGIIQTVITGLALFFLYRFLLASIGVEKLGIWSLVIASTSIAGIANLGLSGSVIKFVARYHALNNEQAISRVIQTTMLTLGLVVGLVLIIFYPLAPRLLGLILKPDEISIGLSILPFAFISIWLSTIYQVIAGSLDGHHRIDLRSLLTIGGTILQFVLAIILVRRFDIVGLAASQVIQYIIILVIGYVLLKGYVRLPWIPYQWDWVLFREMIGYGTNFQAITILVLLFDPITKGLLSFFGGVSTVGYYEMASRLVMQVRSLITSANQALVPAIANLQEVSPQQITDFISQAIRITIFVAVPIYSSLFVAIPAISTVWIGNLQPEFVFSSWLLIIAWFINTLSVPIYFYYLGVGRLRWNTLSHFVSVVANILFGLFLGFLWGWKGILSGFVISTILGALVLYVAFAREKSRSLSEFIALPNLFLFGSGVLTGILMWLLYWIKLMDRGLMFQVIGGLSVLLIFVLYPVLEHPVYRGVISRLKIFGKQSAPVFRD